MALATTIYRPGGVRLTQLSRIRDVAVYQVHKPSEVGTIFETVKIVGEEYPSHDTRHESNRFHRSHRLSEANRWQQIMLKDHPIKVPKASTLRTEGERPGTPISWNQLYPVEHQ